MGNLINEFNESQCDTIECLASIAANYINENQEKEMKAHAMKRAAIGGGVGAGLAGPLGAGIGGRIGHKGAGKWAAGGSLAGGLLGAATGSRGISALGSTAGGAAGGAYGAHRTWEKDKKQHLENKKKWG